MVRTKQTVQQLIILVKEPEFPQGTGEVRLELNPNFDPTRFFVFNGPMKRLTFPDYYQSTPVEKTRRIDYEPNTSRSVIAKGRKRLLARSSSSSSAASSAASPEASVDMDAFVEQLRLARADRARQHRRQKALHLEAKARLKSIETAKAIAAQNAAAQARVQRALQRLAREQEECAREEQERAACVEEDFQTALDNTDRYDSELQAQRTQEVLPGVWTEDGVLLSKEISDGSFLFAQSARN